MRKKNKKTNISSNNVVHNINDFSTFDYEKMAKAIIEAKAENELKVAEIRKETEEKKRKEYLRKIGMKECPEKCSFFKRTIIESRNNLVCLWRFFMLNKKDVNEDTFTFALLQLATYSIFDVIRIAVIIVVLLLLVAGINFCTNGSYLYGIFILVSLFPILLIIRALKISQYEIEKNNDRNYMLSLLSTVTCFVAMILSILSIIISLLK